jgi:predicted NBD/HSP70 family sugar kinase
VSGRNAKHTGQDARRQNRRLVLRIAYEAGATSRAEVARITGLTRASVSDIVRDLVEDGYLRKVGVGESTGGKPPTMFRFEPAARTIVALDLSRQPFVGAVHDLRGAVLRRRSLRATGLTGRQALDRATDLATRLIELAPAPVLGVGVGTPGVIDPAGVVIRSTNLAWRNVPLAETIATRTGLPTHVGNDTSLAALAEFGAQEGDASNLMLVEISDGVGAGIVLSGAIHRGEASAAGEIGHLLAVADGDTCTCGKRGCLETVASVPNILKTVGLKANGHLDSDHPGLVSAVERAADHVGAVLAAAIAILDVHHIVLAGPLNAFDGFAQRVRAAIAERVLDQVAEDVTVTWSKLGDDIVLAGAALHVLRSELGIPW